MSGSNGSSRPHRPSKPPVLKEYRDAVKRATRLPSLPANLDMEGNALGLAMIGDAKSRTTLFTTLEEGDFHCEVNRIVFAGLKEAWKRKVPVNDAGTIRQWLRDFGVFEKLKAIAGYNETEAYALARCIDAAGIPGNATYYVTCLRKLRCERAKLLVATDLLATAHDLECAAWIEQAEKKVGALKRKSKG